MTPPPSRKGFPMVFKIRHSFRVCLLAILVLTVGGLYAGGSIGRDANAAPGGVVDRAIVRDITGAQHITYFSQTAKTPVGVNTPISSSAWCAPAGSTYTKFAAQVVLQGTLTGTNPTAAVTWQHSYDGGTTWITVGSFTTINATVTPAAQTQQVSDVAASTAIIYGDCWRAQLTFGGTSPGGNIGVTGYVKP